MKVVASSGLGHQRYARLNGDGEGNEYVDQKSMMKIEKNQNISLKVEHDAVESLKTMNKKLEEEKERLRLEWESYTTNNEGFRTDGRVQEERETNSVAERQEEEEVRESGNLDHIELGSHGTKTSQNSTNPPFRSTRAGHEQPTLFVVSSSPNDVVSVGFPAESEKEKDFDEKSITVQLEAENEKLRMEWEVMKTQLARAQQEKVSREKLLQETQKAMATAYSKAIGTDSDDDDAEESDSEEERKSKKKAKKRTTRNLVGKRVNEPKSTRKNQRKTSKKHDSNKPVSRRKKKSIESSDAQQILLSSSQTICIDEEEIEVMHSFSDEYFSEGSYYAPEKPYLGAQNQVSTLSRRTDTERKEQWDAPTEQAACGTIPLAIHEKKNDDLMWLSPEPLGLVFKSQLVESVAREDLLRRELEAVRRNVESQKRDLEAAKERERQLENTVSSHYKQNEDLNEEIEQLQEQNREFAEKEKLLLQEKDLISSQTAQQRQALATYERQLEAADTRECVLRKELDESKDQLDRARSGAHETSIQVNALEESLDASQMEVQELLAQLRAAKKENEELRGMSGHQEEMKLLMGKVQAAMMDKIEQHKSKAETLETQLKESVAREELLEKELAMAKDSAVTSRKEFEEEAEMKQKDMIEALSSQQDDLKLAQERIVVLERQLEESLKASSQEKEVLAAKAEADKEALECLNSRLGKANINAALMQKEIAERKSRNDSTQQYLEETQAQLKETQELFAVCQADLEEANEQVSSLSKEIEDLRGINTEVGKAMQEQLDEEKTTATNLEDSLQKSRQRGDALFRELQQTKIAAEAVRKELGEAKMHRKELEALLSIRNGELASSRERVEVMAEQIEELKGLNRSLEGDKEGLVFELKEVEKALHQKNMDCIQEEARNEREATEKMLRMAIGENKKAEVEKSAILAELNKANMRVWYLEREVDRLQQNNYQLEGQIIQYNKDAENICGVPNFLGLGSSNTIELVPSLDTTVGRDRGYPRK